MFTDHSGHMTAAFVLPWLLVLLLVTSVLFLHSNIDLEKDLYSCGDFIEVFDGLNSWSTRLVKYCNTPDDGNMNFVSKANTMRIEFKSNGNINGKGFQAYYTSEDIGKLLDTNVAIKQHCVYSNVHYPNYLFICSHQRS